MYECLYVCMYVTWVPGVLGCPTRESEPLELELQGVSHRVCWDLNPGPARTLSALFGPDLCSVFFSQTFSSVMYRKSTLFIKVSIICSLRCLSSPRTHLPRTRRDNNLTLCFSIDRQVVSSFYLTWLDITVLCNPSWPQIHYLAKDSPEFSLAALASQLELQTCVPTATSLPVKTLLWQPCESWLIMSAAEVELLGPPVLLCVDSWQTVTVPFEAATFSPVSNAQGTVSVPLPARVIFFLCRLPSAWVWPGRSAHCGSDLHGPSVNAGHHFTFMDDSHVLLGEMST